jgi:hypothetical protein
MMYIKHIGMCGSYLSVVLYIGNTRVVGSVDVLVAVGGISSWTTLLIIYLCS